MVIDNEELYEKAINSTKFDIIREMPQINFEQENVIITITKYGIISVEENIANTIFRIIASIGMFILGYGITNNCTFLLHKSK